MQPRPRTRRHGLAFAYAATAMVLCACSGRPIASQPDPSAGSGGGGTGTGGSSAPDASSTTGGSGNQAGNASDGVGGADAGELDGGSEEGGSDEGGSGAGGDGSGRGAGADTGGASGGPPELCTSCGACEEERLVLSANHVTGPVVYEDEPPVGGNHNPCWANWGVHTEVLPAENWVHNLEHGGVVLLHDCDGECDAELGEMETFISEHERTILTEYPDLGARFAIVAWGYRLVSDCWDEDSFDLFYGAHFAQAPENIGSGPPAGCL